jgi:site-specific recombinase XerD
MFETLFQYPTVLARHRDGPSADERQRFLSHRAQEGAARGTLLRMARELLVIAKRINLTTGKPIGRHDLELAAAQWARQQQHRRRSHGVRWSREQFLQVGTSWLRFIGRLQESEPTPSPFTDLIENFAHHMRDERGLSEVTIHARCWHAEKLLAWLMSQNRCLTEVSLRDVDAFLSEKGGRDWGRVSVATCAKALRAFFRHAAMHSWCAGDIAAGINGPRLFAQEALPTGPAWTDVQQLITSIKGDRPGDIRDRAILMLFATYGFRSAEVARLRLEQVDWEREIIAVVRPKQRRAQEYPLIHSVGEAVIRYLQQVRPRGSHREIFLTLSAPFRPLSQGALYNLVSKRLSAMQIDSSHRGPHSLRHACAGHLVAERFSLKEVGDHLGHRSASATRTYAKVDLRGLREVGNFDLGGLL